MRKPIPLLILVRACGAIALALLVASCATPLAVTDQRAGPPAPGSVLHRTAIATDVEDRILALDPLHVSDDDVRQTLALGPAPRIFKLLERTPAYLENCRRNVTQMHEALDRADFQAVTILGHNLRGSGGGFGFQGITDIGAGLEQAAGVSDVEVSRDWVGRLTSYLDEVDARP